MKDLLAISDLSPRDFENLLTTAAEFKTDPHRLPDLLRGELVAMYFAKPSTRTRFSFEAAIHRLGGSAVTVGSSELQLSRGETIEDTARTLSPLRRRHRHPHIQPRGDRTLRRCGHRTGDQRSNR